MRELIYQNEKYQIIKYGQIYRISYFDECISNNAYNRNKKIIQSRITKNYVVVEKLINKVV